MIHSKNRKKSKTSFKSSDVPKLLRKLAKENYNLIPNYEEWYFNFHNGFSTMIDSKKKPGNTGLSGAEVDNLVNGVNFQEFMSHHSNISDPTPSTQSDD